MPRVTLFAVVLLTASLSCAPEAESADTPPDSAPAPAVDPAQFEALRNEAFRLYEGGAELADMRDALLAAHAADPSAYGVNWRLGQVFADLKLNAEALHHFEAAFEARSDDGELLLKIITLQAQLSMDQEALQLLPQLRQHEALAGEALYLEARVRDHAGDREAARALLEQALQLPDALAYRAHSLLARFKLQEGDLPASHALFERALAGRADYKEAAKGLADTCRRLGRDSEADHWDEVLSLLLDLTDDTYIRKRKELRLDRLSRLVQIHPAWEEGFQQLADLQRRTGDMTAACATIDAFLAHHGSTVPDADRQHLRQRYCTEDG